VATGKADALSRSFIGVEDNLDDLIARAEEVRQRDLHRLRLTRP
jgi:hypothetical protein